MKLTYLNNSCLWPELCTDNPAVLADFYREMFDVIIPPASDRQAYGFCLQNQRYFSGCIQPKKEDASYRRPTWRCRILVEDIHQALKTALLLGAVETQGIQDVPGLGVTAAFLDPAGSPYSIVQLDPAITARAWGEQNQFFWASMYSCDPAKTHDFLLAWLDVKILDCCPDGSATRDLFNKLVVDASGRPLFEINRSDPDPEAFPPVWNLYMRANNLELFFAKAESIFIKLAIALPVKEMHFKMSSYGADAWLGRIGNPGYLHLDLIEKAAIGC